MQTYTKNDVSLFNSLGIIAKDRNTDRLTLKMKVKNINDLDIVRLLKLLVACMSIMTLLKSAL